MKKKDKELLLKELCARLPYGVVVRDGYQRECKLDISNEDLVMLFNDKKDWCLKLFLRPMSSMTQAEKTHLNDLRKIKFDTYYGYHNACINYLNSIHVDYNDLIGKGLAIKVTDENDFQPYK